MNTSTPKGRYRRFTHVGPGGVKCPCCCGSSSERRALRKQTRARINNAERKEELTGLRALVHQLQMEA